MAAERRKNGIDSKANSIAINSQTFHLQEKKRMNKFSVWKFNPQPRRIAISMGKTTNILITDECRTHTFDFTVNNNETAARDSDRTVKQMKKKLSKFCYERSNAKYVFLSIS